MRGLFRGKRSGDLEVYMLTIIAMILLLGLLIGWIFSKLKLPSLLGMVLVGIILSPHALNLIEKGDR